VGNLEGLFFDFFQRLVLLVGFLDLMASLPVVIHEFLNCLVGLVEVRVIILTLSLVFEAASSAFRA